MTRTATKKEKKTGTRTSTWTVRQIVTLIANPRLDVSRLTALPQHRELARCLAVAPISPDELRRRCRVRSSDLRGFLQACLFLGLVHWMPDARA